MELADVPWTAVADSQASVALVPVGSTEQHGPHAPLGTDTILAREVARRGAARISHETIVTPPLPFGIAEEHRAFRGTLWLSPDTFRATVAELIGSLAHHEFDAVAIVNGHGGNVAALREVAAEATRSHPLSCAAFTWFEAIDTNLQMGHGGPVETSALLATAPELVDEGALADAAESGADRWGVWAGGVNIAYDTDTFTESGVVGDPRQAGADLGEQLLDGAATALTDLVQGLTESE